MKIRTQQTYKYERFRAVTSGILETAASTFLLLIAVKWFEAGATAKALVAGGGSLGLLITPLVVSRVASLGKSTAKAAAFLALIGALTFLVMAAVPILPVFVAGSILALTTASAAIPLLTQMYQENYPEKIRGHLFSRTVMIRIATAALFSEFAGRALSAHIEGFRLLLVVFSASFAFAAFCLNRCPTRPLTIARGTHPLRSLRFIQEDPLFRRTLVSWMLMGFANLMMNPMRVEFLANPKYGLGLSISEVAFLTGVLPNAVRLILSPIWGWLFDRMNFFVLRVTLNAGFALGILTFFGSPDLPGLIFGSIVFGIANAGGDVAWSLWVTKFAPADHVADYMSVHTSLTGFRGILAPLVGFHLIQHWAISSLGWMSAAFILGASLLLIPEIKHGRSSKAGEALTEDVSE